MFRTGININQCQLV